MNTHTWPNRDPILELGGINLYGFVYNDPENNTDFFGLMPPPAQKPGPPQRDPGQAGCDAAYENCVDKCRNMPKRTQWQRYLAQACYAACSEDYATCLKNVPKKPPQKTDCPPEKSPITIVPVDPLPVRVPTIPIRIPFPELPIPVIP
jgi:hypothetical protein